MYREPNQPSLKAWRFVRELRSPLHGSMQWRRDRPRPGEARLDQGVRLQFRFPDPRGLLQTAYADFRRFLSGAGLKRSGTFEITTAQCPTAIPETYRIETEARGCRILAADTEGIRRGLVFVEDELMRNGGPFLRKGRIERTPVIQTRISRCFFGPIHRPPGNRDELLDDVDYYPDEYLNRLAHEGVNGLWLTVHFHEICRQSVLPEYGRDAEPRLAKLQQTVERCERYGIRIYLFANEPAPLEAGSPLAEAHPELLGHTAGIGKHFFCTSNAQAQAYLEQAMRNLFADVPGLGGLINISIGEGGSHCYSGTLSGNTCPRCSKRKPREVLNDTLSAMERGMHASNPDVELISWPYTQYALWGDRLTVDSAGRLPRNVILQHNFESSVEAEQCGRTHKLPECIGVAAGDAVEQVVAVGQRAHRNVVDAVGDRLHQGAAIGVAGDGAGEDCAVGQGDGVACVPAVGGVSVGGGELAGVRIGLRHGAALGSGLCVTGGSSLRSVPSSRSSARKFTRIDPSS